MIDFLDECYQIPYIIVKEDIVIDLTEEFSLLSGYSKQELINTLLTIVWNDMLRISAIPSYSHFYYEVFMFTKNFEVRLVDIKSEYNNDSNTYIYSFFDKTALRFDRKFPFVNYLYSKGKSGIAIYSAPDLVLLKANRVFLNFLDEPFNQACNSIGRNVEDIVSGFNGSIIERNMRNVLETGEVFDIKEMPHIGYDRGVTYWDTTIVPIYENEVIKYLVQTADEVTESVIDKKQIQEQSMIIKQQKEELEAIIQSMSDAIFIINKDETMYLMNEEANIRFPQQNISNLSDALKNTKYCFLDGTELPYESMVAPRALKGEHVKNFKMLIKHKDKEYITQTTATPIFDDSGDVTRAVICSHDITDLIYQAKHLQEQKEQLEAIIDGISDALIITDGRGKVLKVNDEAKRIYGLSKNINLLDAIKHPLRLLDVTRRKIPLINLPISRSLKGQKTQNHRIILQYNDNELVTDVNSTPIYDEMGNIKMTVTCGRDVTEAVEKESLIYQQNELLLQKEIEKRETLEESIKLKDEFLYLITHEFKTPMAVISSALQAIDFIHRDDMPKGLSKYLNIIKMNNNRQLRLVNNLLDITRINSGHIRINRSKFDIVLATKAIIKSVEVYSKQKGVGLYFISETSKKKVYMDEEKYERILLNLLSNALKFTAKDKSIRVSIDTKKVRGKNMLCIQVEDEGIGIPKDRHHIIFEKFGQADTSLSRQAEGTGLGLHLVKLLVDALEGKIILESQEGKGSIFRVFLPLVKSSASDEIAVCNELNSPLVADDARIFQAASIEFSDIYLD